MDSKGFKHFLEHQGISRKHLSFYLLWIKKFNGYLGTQATVKDLGPEKMECYLQRLARRYEDWQVKQAEHALRLYRYFLARNEGSSASGQPEKWKGIMEMARERMRLRQMSYKTEQSYLPWIRRFASFVGHRDPAGIGNDDLVDFLSHLAVDRRVSKSSQNQALSAILFLFRHILDKDPGDISASVRAPSRRRLPVVLSRQEIAGLFASLEGLHLLLAKVMYGTGIRSTECARLRVKDLDFSRQCLTIRSGKGDKDRLTMLPEGLEPGLRAQLSKARRLYDDDREAGIEGVWLPGALERKIPSAPKSWEWFWVFPSEKLSVDPMSKKVRRHHIHMSTCPPPLK
jgi:integron integrase